MSVLVSRRTISKAEYISEAIHSEMLVIEFLSRLSVRYQRIFQEKISNLVIDITNDCEEANTYFPNTDFAITKRAELLSDAKAKYNALDVQMALIYDILLQNPQGAFSELKLNPTESIEKLNKLGDELGNSIDRGKNLIQGILDSDKKRNK